MSSRPVAESGILYRVKEAIDSCRKPHEGSDMALKMIKEGVAAKEVMEATGISRATYFRLKKAA